MSRNWLPLLLAVPLLGGACDNKKSPQESALLDVKAFITKNLDDLATAAAGLQAAAPAPDADGWNSTADRAAVDAMRAQWKKARVAYESIEGAIAVLFPELDVSTDERYDGFIGTKPDDYLFDDQGVTGVHAIERILWSDSIPQSVLDFEKGLPGYKAAAFPATMMEASDFKTKLCQRLVDDIGTMRKQFIPLALDTAAAYRGVIGSMSEQVEKAKKAATGEEESRYAQYTLADMRTNVAAGVTTFQAFRPWLDQQKGSAPVDADIQAGFKRVNDAYAALSGDSLPPVPPGWSSDNPSPADLQTPFGKLYKLLLDEADPANADSLVSAMNRSADMLGIAQLPK